MAYTVLDSKNINKTKNIYTFGGSGTKPEREDIAENSKLIDYSSGQKFYYDPSKAAGSKWQPDKEPSGGSSGGGLPADFPAEGSANANKFLGFDANGDYTAKDAPSGGGAEKFVVTLTEENDTWTADKTIAEIVAADAAGKIVVCRVPFADYNAYAEIPCWFAQEGFASFGGLITFENVLNVEAQIFADGSDTEVRVRTASIPTSSNAPLIVTLTAGATEGTFVGDKTHKEAYDAFIAGRNVVFYAPAVNGMAETVTVAENNTSADDPYSLATKSFTSSGAANDYITITVGG